MLPAQDPFWGGNMGKKVEKRSEVKHHQSETWAVTINFISFENDDERQRSYELWVESFFNCSD
jgi:hypothetical protein